MAVAALSEAGTPSRPRRRLFVPGGRFVHGLETAGRTSGRPARPRCDRCASGARPSPTWSTPASSPRGARPSRRGGRTRLLGSRAAGRGRHLVRGRGLRRLARRDARRTLAPADRGGVGARGARRARRAPHALGRRRCRRGEVPEPPLSGPWPSDGARPTASACSTSARSSTSGATTGSRRTPTARLVATIRAAPRRARSACAVAGPGAPRARGAASARGALDPQTRAADGGFRVVREVP